MRSLNFRDHVLWPIAYKLGLDPKTNFEVTQASAIGTYINAWVRRAWDSADFADWELTRPFNPINHIVDWNAKPNDWNPLVDTISTTLIGKPLGVYLIDPRTTPAVVDTPWDGGVTGIHVGFDHGSTVWIKYLSRSPIFTTDKWDNTRSYNAGDLTYSPISGQCYKSIVSQNVGNDPSLTQAGRTNLMGSLETLQPWMPINQGLDSIHQISQITFACVDGFTIVDSPPNGSSFYVPVMDSTGTVLGSATINGDGVASISALVGSMVTSLSSVPALAGFIITQPSPTVIQLEANQYFQIDNGIKFPTYVVLSSSNIQHKLVSSQTQAFVPGTSSSPGQTQSINLTMSATQFMPGATYQLTFNDVSGLGHVVQYVAVLTDSPSQVFKGLAAQISSQQFSDTFFSTVTTSLDAVSPALLLSINQPSGVDFSIIPPPTGILWWEFIPFPFDLVDSTVRGANADILKEWGQFDKGTGEEQLTKAEVQERTTVVQGQLYDTIMPRGQPKSRYGLR